MPPSGILYFLLGEAAQNHNCTDKYKTHLSAMREKKSGAVRGSPEFGVAVFQRGSQGEPFCEGDTGQGKQGTRLLIPGSKCKETSCAEALRWEYGACSRLEWMERRGSERVLRL